MTDYPGVITPRNHVEPVPRRVRATLAGETVLDTIRALYVWEVPYYPQFYIPIDDVRPGALVKDGPSEDSDLGTVEVHAVRSGEALRKRAAKLIADSSIDGLKGTVRFEWAAMDAWFEEDEQVFGHPRNPYACVDAIRSTRHVRVELDGTPLAETSSPVMVFETGLPTRYYINRTEVDFTHLEPSDTVTMCPYKGTTSGYWSARLDAEVYRDIAWAYDFPTRQLLPIGGLIAFYNEKVDITLDGRPLERPRTHFS